MFVLHCVFHHLFPCPCSNRCDVGGYVIHTLQLKCLWLGKLVNTKCCTVHETVFSFADAQPRRLLSLLSSSSLPFQLINFLFGLLSPVSSIVLFLYSHLMPFLPLLFFALFSLFLCHTPSPSSYFHALTFPFSSPPIKHRCLHRSITHLMKTGYLYL